MTYFLTSYEQSNRVKGDRGYRQKRIAEASTIIVPSNLRWLKLVRCNCDIQVITDYKAAIAYIFCYITRPEQQDRKILEEILKCEINSDVKKMLFTMSNVVLSHRQIGRFEAAI